MTQSRDHYLQSTNPDLMRLISLRDASRALILGTIDEDGFPSLSTLPFVWRHEAFWVLMSDLSPHTRHVAVSPIVEIMLLEDESAVQNIYNRVRVTWRSDVSRVERSDTRAEEVVADFRARHGKIVDVLLQLSDFHLQRVAPGAGRLVNGFGKAFRIDGFELVEQLRGS